MVSDRERAISTVVDVSLALVMISAAVVLMAVYLQEDPETHEPLTADRTAETVAGTTLTVTYDIEAVTEDAPGLDWPSNDRAYQRSRHGTAATLLAHAAVANASYDGTRATVTAENFEDAIDGALRTRLAGADTNVHITAVWRPYQDSSIQGVATAGPRPPGDEDVSTATMTVPSGITLDRDATVLRATAPEDRAEDLAEQIVDYHFPAEGTVHGLESQGMRRQVTLYRYYGFLNVVGSANEYDHGDDDDPLSRSSADPHELNEEIADDAPASLAERMEPEQRSFSSDERFAEWLTVDEVEIIVRTWNP